jgi:hypothetical protein
MFIKDTEIWYFVGVYILISFSYMLNCFYFTMQTEIMLCIFEKIRLVQPTRFSYSNMPKIILKTYFSPRWYS